MEGKRGVGVAIDFSPCSKKALKWAVENLIRAGDHLVLINVQPEGYYEEGERQLWEATGSPFIPFSDFSDASTEKKYGVKPDSETIELLNGVGKQNEIVVSMKVFYGDPREKICEAVEKASVSCIVIGSRGLSKIKRILLGSVSEYVLNNSACPVTVIKNLNNEG